MSAGYDNIIRRFRLEGESRNLKNLYQTYEHTLLTQMRDEGFSPLLDIEPYYVAKYDREKDTYHVVVALHGIAGGDGEGWIEGETLQQHIQKELSKQHWLESD